LAFTECIFQECNIHGLEEDETRGLFLKDIFFDRPLAEKRAEFEIKLTQALAARKAMGR
jgi:hypothetical protein